MTWNNGKVELDTENTNYSHGSLQKILKKCLKEIGFEKIQKFKNILILGVASGSVIKTLVTKLMLKKKLLVLKLIHNL